jgi:hypothetical protein
MLAMMHAKAALVEIEETEEERQVQALEQCLSWTALLDDVYS